MASSAIPPPPQDMVLQVGDKYLNRESVMPPLQPDIPTTVTNCRKKFQKYGDNTLLFIPTANKFKVKAIESRVKSQGEASGQFSLIVRQMNIESGVGEQPYDENGVKGAISRIRNALSWLDRNQSVIEENKIGTILVVAIENFIQRSDDGSPAVDYGVVAIYNATTDKLVGTFSRGVTVPQAFLDEAQAQGFDDELRKSGKVTVGESLAETFGIDKANWHEVVAGVSRYLLLEEALNNLEVPF